MQDAIASFYGICRPCLHGKDYSSVSSKMQIGLELEVVWEMLLPITIIMYALLSFTVISGQWLLWGFLKQCTQPTLLIGGWSIPEHTHTQYMNWHNLWPFPGCLRDPQSLRRRPGGLRKPLPVWQANGKWLSHHIQGIYGESKICGCQVCGYMIHSPASTRLRTLT